MAAALRVNGDTVGDDSLAELDELTAGDLVATLARIVTGETQIEARSLQQAFAEANAGLRQANTIIGDYQVVAEEVALETAVSGNGHRNGAATRPLDGTAPVGSNGRLPQAPPASVEEESLPAAPPAPRPRLLLGLNGNV